MNLNVHNSRSEMGIAAGKAVERKIVEMLWEKEFLRIIFAAAPSQLEFLDYLKHSSLIPWNRIIAFHMDEYIDLSPDSPALFANFLNRHLFDPLPFHQVHLIDGNKNPGEEAGRYAALLSEAPIDIVCLGIGENGHIAFNDPPVADFKDKKLVKKVELDTACRQQQVNDGCFGSLEEVPLYALTLTVPALIQTDYICCVVPGENKRNALYETLLGHINHSCPASILRTLDYCDLFVDNEAYPNPVDCNGDPDNFMAVDCISEKKFLFHQNEDGLLSKVSLPEDHPKNEEYIGPGLVDLQINGINGIDFNDVELTVNEIYKATQYLLTKGVTTYLPTLITNAENSILELLNTFHEAYLRYPIVRECVAGFHLEGPFISPLEGAKGAHEEKYVQKPSWELLEKFQKASDNRIKLLTLAPEWDNAPEFIQKCTKAGIKVAIGHSLANTAQIDQAVNAGASLSTHLGNGIPLQLPRHPNLLWDQLAEEGLYASLIADGFHVPDSFLKVAIKTKDAKALLVSDATCFAGMAPGEYQSHIGNQVELSEEGRLSIKGSKGLLAGASKNLLENISYLIQKKITGISKAWAMASVFPESYLNNGEKGNTDQGLVRFRMDGDKIVIQQVYKNGKLRFDAKTLKTQSYVG